MNVSPLIKACDLIRCSNDTGSSWIRRATGCVFAFLTLQVLCIACNIPVFRYALERWQADNGEIVVFTDAEPSKEQAAKISALEGHSYAKGGLANTKVRRHRLGQDKDVQLDELWKRISDADQVKLPYVVVRSPVSKSQLVNSWRGSLDQFSAATIFDSPIRKELSKRLVTGGAAVWLVIGSDDKQRSQQLETLLQETLTRLSADVPLPEGIGLPGSELMSEVPLLMKFSVLAVDPKDPKEQHLVKLVHALHPESSDKHEPLVIPVFGRGRALEVIPAGQINKELIEDLTLFLCGACSCQVKEMNPGFDLLMSTDWKTELFGEDAEEPTSTDAATEESDGLPVLIPIPSGNRRK